MGCQYKGELDHKGRRSGLGRMEDRQKVYRLLKTQTFQSETRKKCYNRGEWARDEMEGFGEMVWINSGSFYSGSWQRFGKELILVQTLDDT